MLFHDNKDESAIGLALVGLLAVTMAAILGTVTGNVQPKAPVVNTHPDVASPELRQKVSAVPAPGPAVAMAIPARR